MPGETCPWLALLVLGAVHGINPAMGWLFMVGRGLLAGDRRALWRALGPLALGHALAIGVALALAAALGRVVPLGWIRWVVVASLLATGLRGLVRHRHVRLGGMTVGARALVVWSFLMASAHGAGLMVLPVLLGSSASPDTVHHHHAASSGMEAVAPLLMAGVPGMDGVVLLAAAVHTLGYLGATALVAAVVYEKVGLGILRRAWINLDVAWAVALLAAAVLAALA